ncbi:E3 ubiquitin-protein ligase TRIM21 [Esox lucius]|uniref:B30.2/SPRY domain-containing protein n=1 Tax=Esox lucius TaxID=8010 RepID=A0A3P8ZUU6_ESOLU|nr:E3 ubiquitin-protein ligase TRIM21 [Esox lucius]XP_010897476.2 E3 ubiquitin-protein ligase TRIM21 [Esox lucius]
MMVDTGVKHFNTLRKKQDKRLETVEVTHSEPWNKPTLSNNNEGQSETWAHSGPWTKPLSSSKHGLEQMQTYQECLKLIRQLAEDVKNISQLARRRGVMDGGGPIAPLSLESSKSLIFVWAEELNQLAPLQKTSASATHVQSMRVRRDLDGGKDRERKNRSLERENQLVIEWAKELKSVSEISGLSDKDINRLLCPGAIKEPRLASVLPLLEFFAWSLLSQDNEEDVLKLWLSTKQRALRKPKYIPISVWNWICSASDSVSLDPFSSHPWLAISDDNRQVWEGPQRTDTVNHPQRFDRWSCVLGSPTISTGRHYWEVELSAEGGWRLGVTDVNAPRKGLFSMTPANGFWTLWKGTQNIIWACGKPQTKITVRALLRIVGVYLDFEEGQVSFYDVENRVHIYTFSDKFKGRVVPVFGCHDGDTKISIRY